MTKGQINMKVVNAYNVCYIHVLVNNTYNLGGRFLN